MTGSMAARRLISRRMALVTRRTWPEIQTRNLFGYVWPRSFARCCAALVDVDTTDLDAGQLCHVGDHRAEGVAVIGVAVQRLGMEHELAALGFGDRGGDGDLAAVYGPRPRCKIDFCWMVGTVRINLFGLCVEPLLLAIMGIRAPLSSLSCNQASDAPAKPYSHPSHRSRVPRQEAVGFDLRRSAGLHADCAPKAGS